MMGDGTMKPSELTVLFSLQLTLLACHLCDLRNSHSLEKGFLYLKLVFKESN